jgi:hypothetical protein
MDFTAANPPTPELVDFFEQLLAANPTTRELVDFFE